MPYDVLIYPSTLTGRIRIPPSKSLLHRAIICAALSPGKSLIEPYYESEDIRATLCAIEAFGAKYKVRNDVLIVKGRAKWKPPKKNIHVNASASTLRFFIPLALLVGKKTVFTMDETLAKRPLEPFKQLFGDALKQEGTTLVVNGQLKPGDYRIDATLSSQFVSGLLFALPLLKDASKLYVERAVSRPYVNLTLQSLRASGVKIIEENDGFAIPGHQRYRRGTHAIEGDYSQAAFFLVAGLFHPGIEVFPLPSKTFQADEAIVDFIRNSGGKIIHTENGYKTSQSKTTGFTANIGHSPDLAPPLALLGTLSREETVIENIVRLRLKESDRVEAVVTSLKRLGAAATQAHDAIILKEISSLSGGVDIDACNDHRIAMMIAFASTLADNPVRIKNAQCVDKSYPDFFEDLRSLGGNLTIEDEKHGH